MNRESHRDTPQSAELSGDTIFDSNLEVQAERERLRHEAYEKAQELLQQRIDKYNAAMPKPRVPGAAFQGDRTLKAPTDAILAEFKALSNLQSGQSADAEVRAVLISEREKAKALIESTEKRISGIQADRMQGRGKPITAKEMLEEDQEWDNSPAKAILSSEIAGLNRLISSLEAAN